MGRKSTVDLTGKHIYNLEVLYKGEGKRYPNGSRAITWICKCHACGNTKEITQSHLTSGRIKSCGCSRNKNKTYKSKGRMRDKYPKEYKAWAGIKQRCYNPNNTSYQNYGGRGITRCDRWNSFKLFLEDVGTAPSPDHSLDRIDNNGNYEPNNVRWATSYEQVHNRRCSKCKTVKIKRTGTFIFPSI